MSDLSYDADPYLEHVPLAAEDLDELLEERPKRFLRDARSVWHLISRARATAVALRDQAAHFDHEMRMRSYTMPSTGLPGNLSPEQAARFLSPEQLTRLFDQFSQQRLAALESQISRAGARAERLGHALTAIEQGLGETLNDPSVPQLVRDRLAELIAQLRDEADTARAEQP